MMTQSVMTQAANLFANATGSVTPKGKQTASGFDLIINNNLNSLQSTSGNTEITTVRKTSLQKTSTTGNANSDDTGTAVNQTDCEQTKAVTNDISAKEAGTKQTEGIKSGDQIEDTKTVKEGNTTANEQLTAEIVGMLQNIQQAVMQALKLTPEELEKLLNAQGMSISDLLQPEKLQQLVLAFSGATDITAVLTDENLAATMKDLLKTVEDIKTEAGQGLTKEQIDTLLAQAEELKKLQSQQNTVTTQVNINEKPVSEELQTKQPEAANNAIAAVKEDETAQVKTDTAKDSLSQAAKPESLTESNTSSNENANSDDSKDMTATDPFQAFVDNMVKASKETQVDFSGNMVQVTELRDIANQIIDRIRVTVTTNQTSMELQLNPENLGKVNLTVQSKNGVMTAQFVVQNEVSKEAIESQLHILRETLNAQGVKVEAIEVTVSAYAFEQNSQKGSEKQADEQKENSGKKITLEEAMNMTEASDEASVTQGETGIIGSQIDYTA